jgi:hypothetical protein
MLHQRVQDVPDFRRVECASSLEPPRPAAGVAEL